MNADKETGIASVVGTDNHSGDFRAACQSFAELILEAIETCVEDGRLVPETGFTVEEDELVDAWLTGSKCDTKEI